MNRFEPNISLSTESQEQSQCPYQGQTLPSHPLTGQAQSEFKLPGQSQPSYLLPGQYQPPYPLPGQAYPSHPLPGQAYPSHPLPGQAQFSPQDPAVLAYLPQCPTTPLLSPFLGPGDLSYQTMMLPGQTFFPLYSPPLYSPLPSPLATSQPVFFPSSPLPSPLATQASAGQFCHVCTGQQGAKLLPPLTLNPPPTQYHHQLQPLTPSTPSYSPQLQPQPTLPPPSQPYTRMRNPPTRGNVSIFNSPFKQFTQFQGNPSRACFPLRHSGPRRGKGREGWGQGREEWGQGREKGGGQEGAKGYQAGARWGQGGHPAGDRNQLYQAGDRRGQKERSPVLRETDTPDLVRDCSLAMEMERNSIKEETADQ